VSFIATVPESDATGEVAEIYDRTVEVMGHLPNYTKAFSQRPGVYKTWSRLIGSIRSNMDPRRYELATMGAALALRSTYCSLAHAEKLLELGSPDEELRSMAEQGTLDGLGEEERAIVEFAAKVARSAVSVTEADIGRLRSLGLDDAEIFDVVATAAARCFFSKVLDATGTLADARFAEELGGLAETLTVGRPIAVHSA
jgi:uncharacterized peroxidase-related enzyme